MPIASEPLSRSSVQDAFRQARIQAGIHKRATVHTLWHSYDTAANIIFQDLTLSLLTLSLQNHYLLADRRAIEHSCNPFGGL